jgi:hypothetical protein
MNSEETNNEWRHERWHIDLDWYKANGCSFFILAQNYPCPRCRKRLKREAKAEDVIKAVSTCCSKKENFITAGMPVMSSVFRYFLANGNQPVALETLSKELSEWRGTIAGTSPEVLRRLLVNDRYYGITTVAENVAEKAG